jgi:hypothetical protein
MSNLKDHAIREMERAGVDDDIYGDMTSKAVLELIDTFTNQGHSGMSASLVLSIFNRLVVFGNLSPLTNDPEEWYHHEEKNWQSKRNSEAFSNDEGRTYWLLSESKWSEENGERVRNVKYHQTQDARS